MTATRNRILSLALRAASPLALVATTMPAAAQARAYDIKAQPLSTAVLEYARLSGIVVAAPMDLVKGKSAPAVRGRYTSAAALNKLLEGSGLRAERGPRGGLALVRANGGNAGWVAGAEEGAGNRQVGDPPPQAGGGSAGNGQSDNNDGDIVVTAQKREERLIDAPQSVSVLSTASLDRLGATQFRDFASTVPGLTFSTTGAGSSQVTLRGTTTGYDVGPTVGIYVDEVPYGSSTPFASGGQLALDVGLFDVDRIEVLRGPQGTLYGASTVGGLLKYVTVRPNTHNFGGTVQAGLSDTRFGGTSYNAAAAVNVPIATDVAAIRASGFYSRDGGFIDAVGIDRRNVDRAEVYGGRLDALFTPTDRLTIRMSGFIQDIARGGDASVDYSNDGHPIVGDLTQRRFTAEPFDQKFRLVSGTIAYDLDGISLTSITSYQTSKVNRAIDFTELYAPFLASLGIDVSTVSLPQSLSTKRLTQEVRLASEGGGSLEWIAGGFYTKEKSQNTQTFTAINASGRTVPGVYDYSTPSTFEEYAAFGDLTYRFSKKFDVTGGVRYARNRQLFSQATSGIFGSVNERQRSSEDVFTYLANARYHLSSRATAYVRYATGYRPGGPNLVGTDPVTGKPFGPTTFEADRLKSYEAGFKAETADRSFGIDAAGYYIDWSNMAVLSLGCAGCFSVIANARGGASVRGAELTLTARPIPSFVVTGAFAYQDAKLSEADANLGGRKDERLPNVPRFTAALNADYEMRSNDLRPSVGATLRFISDRTASFDASPFVRQYAFPDYTSIDLRAGVALGTVRVQGYIRNLLDVRGQLSQEVQRNISIAVTQPRTIGVLLKSQF